MKEIIPATANEVLQADCPDIPVSEATGDVTLNAETLEAGKEMLVWWKNRSGQFEPLYDKLGGQVVLSVAAGTRFTLDDPGIYRVSKPVTTAAASLSISTMRNP